MVLLRLNLPKAVVLTLEFSLLLYKTYINKTFNLAWRQGIKLSFCEVKILSTYFRISYDPKFLVVFQLLRHLTYTIFITNNRSLFQCGEKKTWQNVEKSKKYYETHYLQNFLLDFMFSLTTKFVKNSHIQGRVFTNFLKNVLQQT